MAHTVKAVRRPGRVEPAQADGKVRPDVEEVSGSVTAAKTVPADTVADTAADVAATGAGAVEEPAQPTAPGDRPQAAPEAAEPGTLEPEEPDPLVTINFKAPYSYRKHWGIASKVADSNLSQAIIELLTDKYGLPGEEDEAGLGTGAEGDVEETEGSDQAALFKTPNDDSGGNLVEDSLAAEPSGAGSAEDATETLGGNEEPALERAEAVEPSVDFVEPSVDFKDIMFMATRVPREYGVFWKHKLSDEERTIQDAIRQFFEEAYGLPGPEDLR